jgi:proton-translocating NAD(P)+ transhydrogenase subunit alpha
MRAPMPPVDWAPSNPLVLWMVMPMKVGVARETVAGERRVALVPEALGKLTAAGLEILVEAGAGSGAAIPDQAYAVAGATVVATVDLYAAADVILRVQRPTGSEVSMLRSGQTLIGLLSPLLDPPLMQTLATAGVTAVSLDAIPRTLSRAQTMDALSSQANVGGYKAVLIAASTYGRYFPLLTTAAGTAKPANVLILGIGVAGLQAIGTARRLGAVVAAYDVRPETAEQAESLGAKFVRLKTTIDATGSGGYARELTPEERAAQQAELNDVIGNQDIVITTAQVPGRKPPVLVTADAVHAMRSGSVIVDMAASALGGNCELSKAGETVISDNGVTIVAPENLPASMPASASQFYARNISALLLNMVREGALNLDFEEEVTRATVITHGGSVVSEAVRKLLEPAGGNA